MNFLRKKVRHVIQEYDFIGIVERIDESLVIIKILLNLQLTDILLPSGGEVKQSGSYRAVRSDLQPN